MDLHLDDKLFSEESLRNTPARYERFIKEWTEESSQFNFTVFPSNGIQDLVIEDFPIDSMCEHHLLGVTGRCYIGYVPKDKICGLSKLIRAADMFAKRPQLQEKLGHDIANFLMEKLECWGVMVVIVASHSCVSMRGVKRSGALTRTSAQRGKFIEEPAAKDEFFKLLMLKV